MNEWLRTGGLTCILDRKKLKPVQFVAWHVKLAQRVARG